VGSKIHLKLWAEAAQTIAERLNLLPDDRLALSALAQLAEAQAQFDQAIRHLKRLASMSRAEPGQWNNLAWDALFLDALPNDALENAQRAATLSQNVDPAILHTFGCVLAASGKPGEARSVMLQAMDLLGLGEPNSIMWCLYGRIAEEYGEKDAARDAYRRVEQDDSDRGPNSCWELAQRRLKLLASLPSVK
jgi:Flp pilus assembly protein TadD